MRDELVGAVVHRALTVHKLLVSFALPGLPSQRPEPRLIRIDRFLDDAAQKDGRAVEGFLGQRVNQLMKLGLGHSRIVAPQQTSASPARKELIAEASADVIAITAKA